MTRAHAVYVLHRSGRYSFHTLAVFSTEDGALACQERLATKDAERALEFCLLESTDDEYYCPWYGNDEELIDFREHYTVEALELDCGPVEQER